jgi:hypothetical protein
MIYVDHKITLDVHNVAAPVFVRLKKKDSARRILVYLTEKSQPYQITEDCYAVFTAKKPDGKVIFNDCTIDGNTIIYKITDQTTAAVGQFDAEIKLYGGDGKLITSPFFTIVVADTVYDEGDEIESTDEFNALAALIERVQSLETTSALVCKVALPMVALEGMTVSIPVENMSRTPKVGEAFIAMAAKRYTVFQVVAVSQNTFAATVLASVDTGGTGGTGADGFSPVANVTQTDSGAVVTITDKSGTTMATIVNGKDGADGKDGKDGAQGIQGEKGDTGAPGADGAKGDKGDTGEQGEPGKDGVDGKDGANGKDGVSATHSWNGTTLTITSASGTSSANLKGEKGDKGDKGDQGIQGIQGEKGDTGAPGSNGTNGKDGANGTSVTVKSVSESTADAPLSQQTMR